MCSLLCTFSRGPKDDLGGEEAWQVVRHKVPAAGRPTLHPDPLLPPCNQDEGDDPRTLWVSNAFSDVIPPTVDTLPFHTSQGEMWSGWFKLSHVYTGSRVKSPSNWVKGSKPPRHKVKASECSSTLAGGKTLYTS